MLAYLRSDSALTSISETRPVFLLPISHQIYSSFYRLEQVLYHFVPYETNSIHALLVFSISEWITLTFHGIVCQVSVPSNWEMPRRYPFVTVRHHKSKSSEDKLSRTNSKLNRKSVIGFFVPWLTLEFKTTVCKIKIRYTWSRFSQLMIQFQFLHEIKGNFCMLMDSKFYNINSGFLLLVPLSS